MIEEIYANETIRGYLKKMVPSLHEEAHSHLMLDIMTKIPSERLEQLKESKELMYYIFGMARNMVINQSSPFNKLYKNQHEVSYDNIITNEDNEEKLDFLIDESSNVEESCLDVEKQREIDGLLSDVRLWLAGRTQRVSKAYYDEILFKKYFTDQLTFREIADSTKIPLSEIYAGVTAIQNVVQTKFKKNYGNIIN